MATPTKVSAVDEITTDFKDSTAAVLTEYRGLTVAQLKELRRALGADTKFSVVKNTLTGIAAKEAGIDAFDGQLSGPTAIAFIKGDAVGYDQEPHGFRESQPEARHQDWNLRGQGPRRIRGHRPGGPRIA